MLKKILLALIFVITAITNVTHAEDDMKTVASKAYVDTMIETKQLKIPAAGQPNVDAGETVMTYTSTGNGQIGERGLYSDISSYDATTDGDKLITASALNATFTNLPTKDTTKLECANPGTCDLWTIVDQTAYGAAETNLYTGAYYAITVSNSKAYAPVEIQGDSWTADGIKRGIAKIIPVQGNTTYVFSVESVQNAGQVVASEYASVDAMSDIVNVIATKAQSSSTPLIFTTNANTNYVLVGAWGYPTPEAGTVISMTEPQLELVNTTTD